MSLPSHNFVAMKRSVSAEVVEIKVSSLTSLISFRLRLPSPPFARSPALKFSSSRSSAGVAGAGYVACARLALSSALVQRIKLVAMVRGDCGEEKSLHEEVDCKGNCQCVLLRGALIQIPELGLVDVGKEVLNCDTIPLLFSSSDTAAPGPPETPASTALNAFPIGLLLSPPSFLP